MRRSRGSGMPSRMAATAADMPLSYHCFDNYAQISPDKTACHGPAASLLPEIWDSCRDLAELRRIQAPANERERVGQRLTADLFRVMDAGFHQQALAAALDAQHDQALAAPGPVGFLVTGGEVRLAVCPVL